MKYNTLSDHDDVFEIPAMLTTDETLYIGITSLGEEYAPNDAGPRERFAYTFATGPYDADVQWQGDDISGPAIGSTKPADVAATLLVLSSAYGDGDLVLNPDGGDDAVDLIYDDDIVAVNETAQFIYDNAERFGIAGSDLEQGYLAYTDTEWNGTLGLYVRRAFPTGKEPE